MLRFLDQLAVLLNRRRESPNAFAARVGVSHSTMGRIMQGLRPPDVAKLDAWADALDLAGEEREAFLRAGGLANCPSIVIDYIAGLEAAVEAANKRADLVEATLDRLERRVDAPVAPRGPRSGSTGR